MCFYNLWVADGRLQENPVALQEVLKSVSDRISQLPDTDGVYHARVPQLAHTQLSVEHLEENSDWDQSLFCGGQ